MADDQISGSEMRQRLSWGVGIAIGMGVGVAMGTALDNMALGIAIGVAIGLVFAIVVGSIGRRPNRDPDGGGADGSDGSTFDDDSDGDGPASAG